MNDNKFLQTGNRINMQLKFNIAAEPRASGKPVYNKNLFIWFSLYLISNKINQHKIYNNMMHLKHKLFPRKI